MQCRFTLAAIFALAGFTSASATADNYSSAWIVWGAGQAQVRAARPPGLTGYGAASYACTAAKGGTLSDCRLLQETPKGAGVDAAARSLLPNYRAGPATLDGALVEDNVLVTVSFPGRRMTAVENLVPPTVAEIRAAMPPSARWEGSSSNVQFSCVAGVGGSFESCSVVGPRAQDPALSSAALSILPKYSFKAATEDRKPVPVLVSGVVDWNRRVDVVPRIAQPPTYKQLLAAFPRIAWANGVQGSTLISCRSLVDGGLADCAVEEESPKGGDFGAAGLSLAPYFRMSPPMLSGKPVEDKVKIPIRFLIEGPSGIAALFDPAVALFGAVTERNLKWAAAPTVSEVAAVYPADAKSKKVSGWATIQCLVTESRRLTECAVEKEQPAGAGFGAAALSLAPKFHLDAKAHASTTAVSIPFTFDRGYLEPTPRLKRLDLVAMPTDAKFLETFGTSSLPGGFREVGWRLDCRVSAAGQFDDCRSGSLITLELVGQIEPALALAEDFVAGLWTNDGRPVVGQRLTFDLTYQRPKPK